MNKSLNIVVVVVVVALIGIVLFVLKDTINPTPANGLYYTSISGGSIEQYQLTDGEFVGNEGRIRVTLVSTTPSQECEKCYFVWLAENTGGSGTFYHVSHAVYSKRINRYLGGQSVFVGDRIIPESIVFTPITGKVSISYLDRNEDEPFSQTPSVSTELIYNFSVFKPLQFEPVQ